MVSLLLLMAIQPNFEAQLASNSFRERERAQASLLKADNIYLTRKLMRSRDIEVRRRAKYVFEVQRERFLQSLQTLPMLDSLWYVRDRDIYDTEGIYGKPQRPFLPYVAMAVDDFAMYRADFVYYRIATYYYLREQMNKGMTPWQVRKLVREMWELELATGHHLHVGFRDVD